MGSYRLAPEWARQNAVILVWPHCHSDWSNQLNEIEVTYTEMSRYIARHQKLILVAYDLAHVLHIQETLTQQEIEQKNVLIIPVPTNDTWVRDYGPITVKSDSELKFLDFGFDAWGGKYTHDHDDAFNQQFKFHLNNDISSQKINFILEGGNLEVNSKGVLLISSNCFKRRTSKLHAQFTTFERNFENWFGCNRVLWINDVALFGDDTDGHIDTLARYCGDDVVVYSASTHHSDPNNESLDSLNKQLNKIKRNDSSISELIPLPLPTPIFNNGSQLPATYTNFLITNEYVLVPVFNDKQDTHALKTIDTLFPSREIIDIESNTLIQQFGGIHCATMQIPEGCLK
ncbi:MAG: agmatine deiminase [Gammaproteobacteria bacterium]|nr:MAG: agmatine deiminase [Gammaproteobacteria bacterium]